MVKRDPKHDGWHAGNCGKYFGSDIGGDPLCLPCDCGWDDFWRGIKAELAYLTHERDLAVAHDRQPYPTAWAYEQACRVRDEQKAEVARLREALAEIADPTPWADDSDTLERDQRIARSALYPEPKQ